ncbi:hypothetical protein [Candidatus Methylobacter favarea]|nr:hypothetical protein [Candidatus Methylobacter favarea]
MQVNRALSDYVQSRHTRREAGIQGHGWQAQIHAGMAILAIALM